MAAAPLGLIVNPVAGVGGPAGLKGSDGPDVRRLAAERGSPARAGERAAALLAVIAARHPGAEVVTAAGAMGEEAVRAAGLRPRVLAPGPAESGPGDSVRAAAAICAAGVGLLLFVGGDGTARDVHSGAPEAQPLLGVPAGVKMYSACFAVSPAAAGHVAADWLDGDGDGPTEEGEILDVDEEQVRSGRVEPRLFGLARVPAAGGRTQARKAATPASEAAAVRAAAAGAIALMRPGVTYLLGPGGTTAQIARGLGLPGTPIGVDAVRDGAVVALDCSEAELCSLAEAGPVVAVLTVIGGQGFLLGRGNQQLSARLLARMGERPLLVVATESKLIALGGRPLLVDTGDAARDRALAGYLPVVTGRNTTSLYRVAAVDEPGPHTFSSHTRTPGGTP